MDLDLVAPAAAYTRLAMNVRDDQLGWPTPCPQMDVGGLLGHALGVAMAFRDGAKKIEGPTTSTPPSPLELPDHWRETLPGLIEEAVEAWQDPAAWEGMTTVGGQRMPAAQIAAFANDELVVHGWDLARATGQDFDVDPANLQWAWQVVSNVPDQMRDGSLFGPVRPVAEDAPLLDRVLAYAGRDPAWSPPAQTP